MLILPLLAETKKKTFLILYLFYLYIVSISYVKFYLIKILSIKLLLVNGNILSIELANLVKK